MSMSIPFYLHFQMREPESSRNNIKAFFDFFMKKEEGKDELDVAALAKSRPIKLLISCTSGMTSSYFAYTLQNSLSSEGLVMAIDAMDFARGNVNGVVNRLVRLDRGVA